MSVGLFHSQPYGPGYSSKADHEQRMLAFALLETVRIVLEEGRDSEDSDSPVAYDNYAGSDHPSSDSYQPAVQRRRGGQSKAAALLGGPCAHCGATESPQWRRPLTKKVVLCNACGIYFSRHHSLPKRKKVARNNKRAQYEEAEDTDSGELELETLEADTVQHMLPEAAAPPPMHHASKKAHLRSNIKRTDSSSSADCVQHAPAALVSPVPLVSAAAAAAPIPALVLAQTLETASAPAPAAGTYVAATRATRKRRATGPVQPSQDNGTLFPKMGHLALPTSVAAPRPAIAAKSPGVTAATGADSPASQTVASVADSPASSPSALGAGVCLAFAGAATAQTFSPPHSCTGLIQAGMSHQQPQSMAQAVIATQGRTSTNEVSANIAGPNTILIPVTTCRGPRKTPSRKPSNVSSFGVLPQP